jgi:hypothetical protein
MGTLFRVIGGVKIDFTSVHLKGNGVMVVASFPDREESIQKYGGGVVRDHGWYGNLVCHFAN